QCWIGRNGLHSLNSVGRFEQTLPRFRDLRPKLDHAWINLCVILARTSWVLGSVGRSCWWQQRRGHVRLAFAYGNQAAKETARMTIVLRKRGGEQRQQVFAF